MQIEYVEEPTVTMFTGRSDNVNDPEAQEIYDWCVTSFGPEQAKVWLFSGEAVMTNAVKAVNGKIDFDPNNSLFDFSFEFYLFNQSDIVQFKLAWNAVKA